jgi:hypothetical protein
VIVTLYILLNIALAYIDAWKISKHKSIKHGLNAFIYCLLISPTILISWTYPIGLLALRRIIFDTSLNLFRGLPFDYISKSTTSVIDRLSYDFQKKYGYFIYYGIFLIITILCL